jgi:hypothetical protein
MARTANSLDVKFKDPRSEILPAEQIFQAGVAEPKKKEDNKTKKGGKNKNKGRGTRP